MQIKNLHPWDLSITDAKALQIALRAKLKVRNIGKLPEYIAGTDVSIDTRKNLLFGGVVIFRYDDLTEIESRTAVMKCPFPYIPGLLSFREVPVLLESFRRINRSPDVILCDGQGIAHPRGFGLACHLGVFLDIPTIGCAKSRLCGEHAPVGKERGDKSELLFKDKVVGSVLRTRNNVNPLYVSIGYKTSLRYAEKITLHCAPRYRLPEPNRRAHRLVNEMRKDGREQIICGEGQLINDSRKSNGSK